jgi:hypothetical protein
LIFAIFTGLFSKKGVQYHNEKNTIKKREKKGKL